MMFLKLTVALLATSMGYAQQEDPAEVASSFNVDVVVSRTITIANL